MAASLASPMNLELVKYQYQRHPYPGYPLWFRPHWQSGYISAPWFAQKLLWSNKKLYCQNSFQRVLIIGCGDTQPYIIRKLEPLSSQVIALDLSSTNIFRAKLRNSLCFSAVEWQCTDICEYLNRSDLGFFSHMDAFGVLHHLPDPKHTISLIAKKLQPGGTIRIMVYNRTSRAWIHLIQKLAKLAHLSHIEQEDIAHLTEMLTTLGNFLPDIKNKLDSIGQKALSQTSWLVDAFLHAREMRRDLTHWLDWFTNNELIPYALYDRYCELDDLANPLWIFPDVKKLKQKADTGMMKGHWEIFLYKDGKLNQSLRGPSVKLPWTLYSQLPRHWNRYEELHALSWWQKRIIWHNLLNATKGRSSKTIQMPSINLANLKRLARLGAILPDMLDAISQHIARQAYNSCDEAKNLSSSLSHQNSANDLNMLFKWWQEWLVDRRHINCKKRIKAGQKILQQLSYEPSLKDQDAVFVSS